MKLLVIYQYYQDSESPGHSLIYELTQFLAERGHAVTVVSGETGYMQTNSPTLPWYRRLLRVETVGKVKVIRTYTYSELHRSYLGRLLSFISFTLTCPLGIFKTGPVDVAMGSSPPIFPVFSAWLTCKLKGIPFVMEVRDLWPASAVQMGILRNKALISIMSWMERTLYNKSRRIIALTDGIRSDICSRGWPENKIDLVTCGADFDRLFPDPEARANTRREQGWENKTIVLYFGAIGEANNIPVILRTAKRLESRTDILFVLVGNGIKRRATEMWLNESRISNVHMLPAVPKTSARHYICGADICLATLLDIPLFDGAIPTKLIDYMACGKPVLCGIRGEAQSIVEASGAGLTFEPDADEQLSAQVLKMADDAPARELMGRSGLAYVTQRFSAEKMREQTEAILLDASSLVREKVASGAACQRNRLMGDANTKTVAIIGVRSHVGPSLVAALRDSGLDVIGFSRSPGHEAQYPIFVYDGQLRSPASSLPAVAALVSLAPLPEIVDVLNLAKKLGVTRLIAFGSTGIFSKAESSSPAERQFVRDQLDAERRLAETAHKLGIRWTLFRPTMIYGAGADQNVAFIQSMIRRFHVFPIAFGSKGLRQPVHVDDLAAACIAALENEKTYDRAYNLGGGEVISYPQMVRRIGMADGRQPRLVPIPAFIFRHLVRALRVLPGFRHLNESMVDRMLTDLVTDHSTATQDFGYSPRPFVPPGAR